MWLWVLAVPVLVAVVLFVVRHLLQLRRGAYRAAGGTEPVRWVPGNGRHGGM